MCSLNLRLDAVPDASAVTLPPIKVRWDKADRLQYEHVVSERVSTMQSAILSLRALDAEICKLNKILVDASEQAGHSC